MNGDPNSARNARRRAEAEAEAEHGFSLMSKRCDCDLCKAYSRGYRVGHQTAMNQGRAAMLYDDDPFLGDLLP